jgi:hypothetical protein
MTLVSGGDARRAFPLCAPPRLPFFEGQGVRGSCQTLLCFWILLVDIHAYAVRFDCLEPSRSVGQAFKHGVNYVLTSQTQRRPKPKPCLHAYPACTRRQQVHRSCYSCNCDCNRPTKPHARLFRAGLSLLQGSLSCLPFLHRPLQASSTKPAWSRNQGCIHWSPVLEHTVTTNPSPCLLPRACS